jgi:AcrR family transcriptional regulator
VSGRKQFDVDEALDRAMRVFWELGYAETSLDTLGRATGLGRGSLYGAFGAKDDLFRRSLERYAALYEHRYEEAVDAHAGDPVAAVGAYFDVVLDRIADPTVPDGCLVVQSAAQLPTLSPESRKAVNRAVTAQRRRVRRALDAASAHQEPAGLDSLALLAVGVQHAIVVLSRTGAPAADLRSLASAGVQAVADRLAVTTR